MKNHVLIVEGPAGSGKSTLITQIDLVLGPQIFTSVDRSLELETGSRKPVGDDIAGKAFVNDVNKIGVATRILATGSHRVVAIDRLGLSQYIYGQIRSNDPLGLSFRHSPMAIMNWLQASINANLALSGLYQGQWSYTHFPQVHWLLMDPSTEGIIARRESSPKPYPFGTRDLEVYRKAYAAIRDTVSHYQPYEPIPTITFVPDSSHDCDLWDIIDAIKNEDANVS